MGLFNNKFIIDEEDIFKNDKLNRKQEIETLISVFTTVGNQMVIAVNSPWGTGKTTFLKMCNCYLRKEGYSTVFFNSWKSDFVEDPFIAFVEEIKNEIGSSEASREFMESAKTLGVNLFKELPSILKKAFENKTGLDIDSLKIDESMKEIITEKFDDYNKNKESVKNFKRELAKLADKIFEEKKKPLIIFVDELDRCRPNFAIKLLERIKHYFNIENIIFILGIDKEALSNSIKVVYGNGTDINGYLSRFINIDYNINVENNKNYIDYLLSKYNFEELPVVKDIKDFLWFSRLVKNIINIFDLSLRDIQKILVKFFIILKLTYCRYIELALFLIILKKIDKDIFYKIANKSTTMGELENYLTKKYNFKRDIGQDRRIILILKVDLIEFLGDKEFIKNIEKNININNYNCPNQEFIRAYEQIKNRNSYNECRGCLINNVIQKINLYQNIDY